MMWRDDVEDDNIDELQELSEEEAEAGTGGGQLLFVTELLPRYAIMKQKMFAFFNTNFYLQVRQLSFAIIHSTTIALPA